MLTLFTIAIMILFTKCLLWGTIRKAARDWVGQITNIHTIQIQATRPPPSMRRRHVMERGVLRLDSILSHNQYHHQCTIDCMRMLKGAYHQYWSLKPMLPGDVHSPLGQGPGVGSSSFQPQFRDRLSFSSLNLGTGHTQELASLPPGHAGFKYIGSSQGSHHNIS